MNNPNIVLIVMDAVRAGNMSIYGYEKETTPMLKSILPDCVLYKNAISSSYWTLPSYASTFTGTYVSRHGLTLDGDVLDRKFITMAQKLRDCGYKTICISPTPYVSKFSGLHRGFQIFLDPTYVSPRSRLYKLFNEVLFHTRGEDRSTEEELRGALFEKLSASSIFKSVLWKFTGFFDKYAKISNSLAFGLIERVKAEPFFICIHYNETHAPYILPRSFRERFLSSIPAKKLWDLNQNYLSMFHKHYTGEAEFSRLDFSLLSAFYDGGISYLDTRISEVYSFLEKKGLLDDTMVIITSDHGDSFGEHGILFHIFCLYDTLIKIPLVIKYPVDLNLSGVENRMVQNTDLLPTIMDILKIDDRKMHDQIQGNSLVSSNINNRDYSIAISELVKPFGPRMLSMRNKLEKYNRQLISIRTEDKKYIYASDGNHEFYDMRDDPDEKSNLIESQDHTITELRKKLKPWLIEFRNCCNTIQRRIDRRKPEADLETEAKKRLKALGYF